VEQLPQEGGQKFAGPERRMAIEMLTAVRSLDLIDLRCSEIDAETEAVRAYLETMEIRLKDFAQQLSAHYLSRVQSTPHFSISLGDRKP
jgi:hypothetical protein